MPRAASATAPRTAIRSAILGVKRYGAATRGSGGRKRGRRARVPVLAKELHPLHALGPHGRREQAPDEGVDRPRQEQVQRDRLEQRVEEDDAGRRRVAEDEVEEERTERVEDRDHRDGDERRV